MPGEVAKNFASGWRDEDAFAAVDGVDEDFEALEEDRVDDQSFVRTIRVGGMTGEEKLLQGGEGRSGEES